MKHRFKAGDRVRLTYPDKRNPESGKLGNRGAGTPWTQGNIGTITKLRSDNSGHIGDQDYDLAERKTIPCYGIRFDNYDYGPSPSNCHSVGEIVLEPNEPAPDEVAAAIASITGRLEESPHESLYLVGACGKPFDDLRAARDHLDDCDDCCEFGGSFHIVPEGEARE